jgi:hypothetical protein
VLPRYAALLLRFALLLKFGLLGVELVIVELDTLLRKEVLLGGLLGADTLLLGLLILREGELFTGLEVLRWDILFTELFVELLALGPLKKFGLVEYGLFIGELLAGKLVELLLGRGRLDGCEGVLKEIVDVAVLFVLEEGTMGFRLMLGLD